MTHGDEELELYTAEQVSLRDGMLVLTTAKKTAMHGTKEYVMFSQSHVLYCPIYADVRAIY